MNIEGLFLHIYSIYIHLTLCFLHEINILYFSLHMIIDNELIHLFVNIVRIYLKFINFKGDQNYFS